MKDQVKTDKNNLPKDGTKVAIDPKKNMVIIAVLGLIFIFIMYNLYKTLTKKEGFQQSKVAPPANVMKPVEDAEKIAVPQLPPAPKLVAPTIEPALPTTTKEDKLPEQPKINIAPPASLPQVSLGGVSQQNKNEQANSDTRRKSGIIAFGGAGASNKDKASMNAQGGAKDSIVKTDAVSYKASGQYLLARGKMVDAITESVLDSEFGGEVRAIVSNDVYSQNGKVVLIPKGSRVFGNYNNNVGNPVGHLDVKWFRIDLPNGYSLNLGEAFSVDNLGRKGAYGNIDRRVMEQISNSLFTSAINIAIAKGLDVISPPTPSTTTTGANSALVSTLQATMNNIVAANSGNPVNLATALCAQIVNGGILATINSDTQRSLAEQCAVLTPANAQNIATLIQQNVNTLATGSSITTTASNTSQAATKAYKDLGDTIKNISESDQLKLKVTVPQGTAIKIYVNQDFIFPSKAVNGYRMVE